MSTILYEIVMLPDGDFALQRTDEDAAPLVKISFSDEAKDFVGEAGMEIARAMIDAGMEAFETLGSAPDDEMDLEMDDDELELQPQQRVLH